jgi:hypothetical protein
MDLDVKYYPLVGLNGRMVYIFKLAPGQHGWNAEEIAEKARSTLKAGDYSPDIVVMEGEPSDDPKLFGSSSCVSYIRSILQTLAYSTWNPAVLS